jgi:hypothetical protein
MTIWEALMVWLIFNEIAALALIERAARQS